DCLQTARYLVTSFFDPDLKISDKKLCFQSSGNIPVLSDMLNICRIGVAIVNMHFFKN
ncbi:unnamed protein product, partial [Callosobruchus maculatus]